MPTFASAGPADDASMRFKAIAAGNVERVMQGYADKASLQWVGGPLDGVYAGTDKLREVWGKFAKANAPLEVSVSKCAVRRAGQARTAARGAGGVPPAQSLSRRFAGRRDVMMPALSVSAKEICSPCFSLRMELSSA